MRDPDQSSDSIIDQSERVTGNMWVVSLVVSPKSKLPEHAFLVLEGIKDDHFVLRRYDFYLDDPSDAGARRVKAKIVPLDKSECPYGSSDEERQKYFWSALMREDERDKPCHSLSWRIELKKADVLHTSILKQVHNPPEYQVSGDASLFAASSDQRAHNCYTWCRKELLSLDVDKINADKHLEITMADKFFASVTSLHIFRPPGNDKPVSDTPDEKPACQII